MTWKFLFFTTSNQSTSAIMEDEKYRRTVSTPIRPRRVEGGPAVRSPNEAQRTEKHGDTVG